MGGSTCSKCGELLALGDFAHDQQVCWDCFKAQVMDILENLVGEERETVVWMLTVMAELYDKQV